MDFGGRCDNGDKKRNTNTRDRAFFSGVAGRVVKGIEFFVFSLVNVGERKAYPVAVRQMVRLEAEKAALKRRKRARAKKSQSKTKKKSKPKGSKNKDKNEFVPSAELLRINGLLEKLLKLIRRFIAVRYLALDGHFGHHQAVLMARRNELHLIGKMRRDAALWEKYDGKYNGKGRKRVYGKKIDYENLPHKYWKKSEREGELITNYYQAILLHKEFGCELNVVIIERVNLKTKQIGHAILFSSDVELGWEKLMDYYKQVSKSFVRL